MQPAISPYPQDLLFVGKSSLSSQEVFDATSEPLVIFLELAVTEALDGRLDKFLANALATSAMQSYRASLRLGGRDPRAMRFFNWCTKPQVGQLVVGESSKHVVPAFRRVGILRAVTMREAPGQDPMEGPLTFHREYTLELLDGSRMEWSNCYFIAIAEEPFE